MWVNPRRARRGTEGGVWLRVKCKVDSRFRGNDGVADRERGSVGWVHNRGQKGTIMQGVTCIRAGIE